MAVFSSKWFVIALVLACLILLVLYFLGRKSVHAELVIPATPEEVWSVLSDASGFKDWNPVLVPVEGEFREEAKLNYQMTGPDGKKTDVQAKVIKFVDQKLLNQYGGIPGIMTFNHTFRLEQMEGGTLVIQHEEYRGIGVVFWDPSWFETAYLKALENLRDRVLQLKNQGDSG